jgi:hypothetical protein
MQKNYVIFSKCDNVIENHSNTHAMTSFFFFEFEILHKCEK